VSWLIPTHVLFPNYVTDLPISSEAFLEIVISSDMWKKLYLACVKVHTHPYEETGENKKNIYHNGHYLTEKRKQVTPKYG
jgi:hypothetical protein